MRPNSSGHDVRASITKKGPVALLVALVCLREQLVGIDLFALESQFDFVASGDYDGDGNDDVMWRRKETGQTVVWLMTRPGRMIFANSGVLVEADWVGEAAANFNNSIEDDVLWRNHASGETRVWYMDDFEAPEEFPLNAPMPSDWSLLASGDMDGDGRADLTWFDTNTNLLEVWRMDESEPNGFRVE